MDSYGRLPGAAETDPCRHPVERIAGQVGFGSPTTFRDRFRQLVGVSPPAYRRTFQRSGG